MKKISVLITSLLLAGLYQSALARESAGTGPEALGFSATRLARMDGVVQQAVDEGQVAGAVVLVRRRGEVAYLRAFGQANVETGREMRTDDLFRIASMTKAITSVGVMMLFEEGSFMLNDPVGRYLPSFDKAFEVAEPTEDGYRLVPASGPITIRQLLTHTSGLSYRFIGVQPLTDLYTAAGLSDGLAGETILLADFVPKLAGFPLAHQPGAKWSYGLNTDVLGRLIEVLSGQTLDRFFADRIFTPLGMNDSFFEVPPSHYERIAAVHRHGEKGGLVVIPPGRIDEGPVQFSVDYPYDGQTGFLSGGAGMTSTAADYGRFLQMLLNGGSLNGQRLLGPKTVELMTSNQTGDLEQSAFGAAGFTLGFALDPGPESGLIQSAGTLGWGGFFSTDYFFDIEEELVGVLMTQHYPYGHELMQKYKVMIYQALEN